MPTFEYRRLDGSTFEVLHRFGEDPLTHDPETGDAVTRVYTAPAVAFHGSGFYTNDVGTVKGNRELEKAASDGADAHDQKMADQRKERAKLQKPGTP